MKKIINNPENFVEETLDGIYYAHSDIVTYADNSKKAMVLRDLKKGKVSIATGGGSGHLPLFLGYLGKGMLDGCSVGEVFASPGAADMVSVTKAIDQGAGVLYIYGNYGGDKMNFTMAAEQSSFEKNIKVLAVRGCDDVAVKIPENRRGIAGIFFVYKCAGAAASEMLSLEECYRIAQKAADNVRTMGVSLSSCTLPRVGHPSFEIAEDEMEIGMGIHGEPGVRRGKITRADEIVDEMLEKIMPELNLSVGSEVAILINGLGATPLEEQYIVNRRVHQAFKQLGIKIFHSYVGEYATSMEMAGLSISVLKLDKELKKYLSAPADAIMFKQFKLDENKSYDDEYKEFTNDPSKEIFSYVDNLKKCYVPKRDVNALDSQDFLRLLANLKEMALQSKEFLVKLDSVAGDGDLGLSMADGFAAVNAHLGNGCFNDVGDVLYYAGKILSVKAPSSLGTLIAFGFVGAGKAAKGRSEISLLDFVGILEAFEQSIMSLGKANVGDKTFLDGFDPALKILKTAKSNEEVKLLFGKASEAAIEGSRNTVNLVAKFGRIAFKGEESKGILDPGSALAALMIKVIAATFG